MVTDEATQIVPNLTLHVDGETARLSSVPVTWAPCKCHGVIGQDVLRLGAGYVIDFNSMRLEILPRAN